MNCYGTLLTCSLIATFSVPAVAQEKPWEKPEPLNHDLISIGYNSFNEVFIGAEFPRTSHQRVAAQVGYQFAITSNMSYTWGPLTMTTPFLTNNCEGVRARVGYHFLAGRKRSTLFGEFQQLESNPFVVQDYSGSNMAPSYHFTESHKKFGVRFMNATPIGNGNSAFFTFSIGVFYTLAHRTHLDPGTTGSIPPDYDSSFVTPQLTIGLQFLLF